MHVHHAQLLVGSSSWAFSVIPEEERRPGPDVLIFAHDTLSIATVRELVRTASLRPVVRTHRTFIIDARSIPVEAQNALLKLLEEPNEDSLFYLIVQREDILLPTLRSRLHLLSRETESGGADHFAEFYRAGYAERLSRIADRVAEEDSAWVSAIMRGLETYARTKKDASLMEMILKTESYLEGSGSSKKMLLEHLALSLPARGQVG